MNNKYTKPLLLVIAFLILALTTIASYAYFTASVNGNNNAQTTVITTGNMAVEYEEGDIIGTKDMMLPGQSISKIFNVKNTGTVDATYNIYLNNVHNTFDNKEEIVYELISDNGTNITETRCPSDNTMIAQNISIGVNETHHYTLKVTFKETNENQDDNKGEKFRARISLEKAKFHYSVRVVNGSLGADIVELFDNGATDLIFQENISPDDNIRYIGTNPNNYIYFNCYTTNPNQMNDTTCERWRIIGLMNNISNENGNIWSRVKIIRDEPIGQYAWDTSNFSINKGLGINQWGESTYEDGTAYEGADLMRELNTDYLGNITVGTDGKWYASFSNYKNNMPSYALNQSAQKMIETVVWNLGSPSNSNGTFYQNWTSLSQNALYVSERANTNGKVCTSGDECNDNVVRTSTWTGKVGLIYPSDYIYSTSETICKYLSISWYDQPNCYTNSWIYNSEYDQWTISPLAWAHSDKAIMVTSINSNGRLMQSMSADTLKVRPVVFLKLNVGVISGDGSSTNPYKIKLQ